MSESTPVSVRFDQDQDDRLQKVADASGIKKAQLIRMATDEFLDRVERDQQLVISVRDGYPRTVTVPAHLNESSSKPPSAGVKAASDGAPSAMKKARQESSRKRKAGGPNGGKSGPKPGAGKG